MAPTTAGGFGLLLYQLSWYGSSFQSYPEGHRLVDCVTYIHIPVAAPTFTGGCCPLPLPQFYILCHSTVMLSPSQLNWPEIQTVLLEWPLKNYQSISRRLVMFTKHEVMWDSEKEEYSTRSSNFLEYSKMQVFSWINNRNWWYTWCTSCCQWVSYMSTMPMAFYTFLYSGSGGNGFSIVAGSGFSLSKVMETQDPLDRDSPWALRDMERRWEEIVFVYF